MQNHLIDYEDAHALKSRLDWGQPSLTILDVRDRFTFNHGHIMGAIPMPLEDLTTRAKTCLHQNREIVVYGENDAQAAQAVSLLRGQGFNHVSELKGGLSAWKAIGGAVEGM
ncbi:rhodanese-like domain-containing protein [Calothrix sp. NIES-3974]|uniref:rhodanese-like domain-containing protein n=1 Tax=Calothrix sp. NIES-3974 TaxID=2005462 RepID=UPI000B5E0738|nr:rhodanese-like domain-containing protein [Calothrix sp. NIES-3974]BAZ05432.1 rhodanese-like protein [Calothrix sp. NIES-3974]